MTLEVLFPMIHWQRTLGANDAQDIADLGSEIRNSRSCRLGATRRVALPSLIFQDSSYMIWPCKFNKKILSRAPSFLCFLRYPSGGLNGMQKKAPFIKGDGAFLWAAEIGNFGGKGAGRLVL